MGICVSTNLPHTKSSETHASVQMSVYNCILIASLWQRRHWYTELLQQSIAKPINIPRLKKSSTSTKNTNLSTKVFKLTTRLLSTEISEIKDFHETLESYSEHPLKLVQNKITQANTKCLIAGVVRGKRFLYSKSNRLCRFSYIFVYIRFTISHYNNCGI